MGRILCEVCGKRCVGDVLRVSNRYFHKECFQCCKCLKSLETGGFFERDAKLYCPLDYQHYFCVQCKVCGKQIEEEEEAVSALQLSFHRQCFSCSYCGKYFQPGDHVTRCSSNFYCKSCSPRFSIANGNSPKHKPTGNIESGGELPSVGPICSTPLSSHRSVRQTQTMCENSFSVDHTNVKSNPDAGYESGESNLYNATSAITVSQMTYSAPSSDRHITQKYLLLQERGRPSSVTSSNTRDHCPVYHFHQLTRTDSNVSWIGPSRGSSSRSQISCSDETRSLPSTRPSKSSSIQLTLKKPHGMHNILGKKLSPVAEQGPCWPNVDFGDPLEVAEEARLQSMWPSGLPWSATGNAPPIERQDWPAPPEPSVTWRQHCGEGGMRPSRSGRIENYRRSYLSDRSFPRPPLSTGPLDSSCQNSVVGTSETLSTCASTDVRTEARSSCMLDEEESLEGLCDKRLSLIDLDPISSSRSPSADMEPKLRTRYIRHRVASPSREFRCNREHYRHRLGYSTNYVNLGNRKLTLNTNPNHISSPAINSMISVLQSYDEIRQNYVCDGETTTIPDTTFSCEKAARSVTSASCVSKAQSLPMRPNSGHEQFHFRTDPWLNYTSDGGFVSPPSGILSETEPSVKQSIGQQKLASRGGHRQGSYSSSVSIVLLPGEKSACEKFTPQLVSTPGICSRQVPGLPVSQIRLAYPYRVTASGGWEDTTDDSVTSGVTGTGENIGSQDGMNSQSPGVDYRGLKRCQPMLRQLSQINPRNSNSLTSVSSANFSPFEPPKIISYEKLKEMRKVSTKEVDKTKLETFLSEEEFYRILKMPRTTFYLLPEWKRNDLKRRVGLFE